MRQLAVNWAASFFGNLAGALLAVSAIAGAGLVGNSGPAIPVALAKVQLPFSQARPRAPARSRLPGVQARRLLHCSDAVSVSWCMSQMLQCLAWCFKQQSPASSACLWVRRERLPWTSETSSHAAQPSQVARAGIHTCGDVQLAGVHGAVAGHQREHAGQQVHGHLAAHQRFRRHRPGALRC